VNGIGIVSNPNNRQSPGDDLAGTETVGTSDASVTSPAIGQLIWSEEFNGSTLNTSTWTATDGNGCQINLCGYGNAELEYYSPNNLSIADVPFEPGTRALAIKAQRQTVGSNVFTSGKIDTKGKVQVQYGMIEVRMATPNLQTGCGRPPGCWASARRPGRATARSTSWRWATRPPAGRAPGLRRRIISSAPT
jgi:beta-glucanase (GH16 family)